MRLLFSLLLFFQVAQANTKVSFADLCSGEDIKIATPNGTTLKIDIDDIDNYEDLTILIKFRPAGEISDLKDKSQEISFRYKIDARKIRNNRYRGFFKLPKKKLMNQIEVKNSFFRIWDAEVKWFQNNSHNSGSSIASFYRSSSPKSFFQINSPGICQWEDEPNISSKLYENNTTGFMNISRETSFSYEQYSTRGFSLGYNRNYGGVLPVGALGANSYGWFFKDWENQVGSREFISLERKYVLHKEEAGIFFTRMSFNRHQVTRYEWSYENSSCGRYEPTANGHLDVGILSEDFIVLPPYLVVQEEKLKDFIDVVRPPINNCQDSIDTRSQVVTDIIPSANNGILYFYETNRSFP